MYEALKRLYHRVRRTILARLTLPNFLAIEDSNITIRAWNWPVHAIASTGTVCDGRFYYEQREMEVARKMMKGKRVFYDIGACIGYYSYVAIAQGVPFVVAFEPINAQAKVIKEAAKRQFLNITVVTEPVGREAQEVISDNKTGYARKRAISIDSFARTTGRYPDLMKIDVEGYEADVVEGAREVFLRSKPDIILSLHVPFLKMLGRDADELLGELTEVGYGEAYPRLGSTLFLRHKTVVGTERS